MTCSVCSFKNDAGDLVCRSCGARLTTSPTGPATFTTYRAARAGNISSEAAHAESERRLAAFSQQVSAARTVSASIDELSHTAMMCAAIDIDAYHVTFGHPHGATVEKRTPFTAPTGSQPPQELRQGHVAQTDTSRTGPVLRAATAVWAAFENGACTVQICGRPGAGATRLLGLLATHAREHGYADALWLTDVVGPAADIGERLAALAVSELEVFHSASPQSETDGAHVPGHALILLDRADLSATDVTKLQRLLPSCRFVIVQKDMVADSVTVELGMLTPDEALKVLADVGGRRVDEDNARVAIDIAKTVGLHLGPVRLIGHAAREMQRSFISLRLAFERGDTILHTFVVDRPPNEARILSILAYAGIPLSAPQIAYVAGGTAIHGSLARLAECEFVRLSGGLYQLPEYVARHVPLPADTPAVLERVLDIFSAAFALSSTAPLPNRQLFGAETLLHRAFARRQWECVTTLGLALAQAFALRRMFGAWGRVLDLVESATWRANDKATRNITRHQLGVRALVLGKFGSAAAYFQAAARDRSVAGDVAGAAATTALMALIDDARALAPSAPSRAQPARSQGAGRARSSRTPLAQTASSDTPHATEQPDQPAIAGMACTDVPPGAHLGKTKGADRSSHEPNRDQAKRNADKRRHGSNPDTSLAAVERLSEPTQPVHSKPTWSLLALSVLTLAVVALLAIFMHPLAHPALEITRISPERTTIHAGESTQICVRASNAAVVEVFPDAARLPVAGRRCVTVHPVVTTKYIAVATSADGSQVQANTTVDVLGSRDAQPDIVTFAAFPARIRAGGSTRLCYAVTGANLLRMVPRTQELTRLRSCATVTLREPHRYIYRLFATDQSGRSVVRQARVDVVAATNASPGTAASQTIGERGAKQPVELPVRTPALRPPRAVAKLATPIPAGTASAVRLLAHGPSNETQRGAWEIQEANRWDGTMVWHGNLVRSGSSMVFNLHKHRVAGRLATSCERQTDLHAALSVGVAQQIVPYHEVNCTGATSIGEVRVVGFSRDERSFRGSFWRGGIKLGDFDARKL